MESRFKNLIEEIIETKDFSKNPEHIFELLDLLNSSDNTTFTASKIFLIKYGKILDIEFVVDFLSKVDKNRLSNDVEVLEFFDGNDEVLLFLKL